MKFYVPCDKSHHIDNKEVEWLSDATLEYARNRLVLYEWADGYIFEADESFQTFFSLKTGLQIPYISDQEYNQFIVDKIAYLNKTRVRQIREVWGHLNPKINNR